MSSIEQLALSAAARAMRIMRRTSPRPSTVVFWRASRPRGRARRSEKVEAANVDFQIGDSFRFACLLFLNRDPQEGRRCSCRWACA